MVSDEDEEFVPKKNLELEDINQEKEVTKEEELKDSVATPNIQQDSIMGNNVSERCVGISIKQYIEEEKQVIKEVHQDSIIGNNDSEIFVGISINQAFIDINNGNGTNNLDDYAIFYLHCSSYCSNNRKDDFLPVPMFLKQYIKLLSNFDDWLPKHYCTSYIRLLYHSLHPKIIYLADMPDSLEKCSPYRLPIGTQKVVFGILYNHHFVPIIIDIYVQKYKHSRW